MRPTFKTLSIFLLFGIINTVYAQSLGNIDVDHLKWFFLHNISANDLSLDYLTSLFGNFYASGFSPAHSAVNILIKYLNFGVLLFVGGLITYSTSMHVIKTASQGTAMGQKEGSYTTVIRVGSAVSLAIPLPAYGGYCALQLFILNMVLQGIGVADYAWSEIVDIFQKQGSILPAIMRDQTPPASPQVDPRKNLMAMSQKIIQSQVCYLVNYDMFRRNLLPTDTLQQSYGLTHFLNYTPPTAQSNGSVQYAFPGKNYFNCGSIGFNGLVSSERSALSSLTDTSSIAGIKERRWYLFKEYFEDLLINVSQPLYNNIKNNPKVNLQCQVQNNKIKSGTCLALLEVAELNGRLYNQIAAEVKASEDYFNPPSTISTNQSQLVDPKETEGWLTAGMLYHNLIGGTFNTTPTTSGSNALAVDASNPFGFTVDKPFDQIIVGNNLKQKYRENGYVNADFQNFNRLTRYNKFGHSCLPCDKVEFRCQLSSADTISQSGNATSCQGFASTSITNLIYPAPQDSGPISNQRQNLDSLKKLKQQLWYAAYNIMPKQSGADGNLNMTGNYSTDKDKINNFIKTRTTEDASTWHLLECAGMSPFSVPDNCKSGSSSFWSGFIALGHMDDPAKNIFDKNGFGYDVTSRSRLIVNDIQLFIMEIYDSWVQLIVNRNISHSASGSASDDSRTYENKRMWPLYKGVNWQISYDPLRNLQMFGASSVGAAFGFMERMVQDTMITNRSAVIHSLILSQQYGLAAQGLKIATTGVGALANLALEIPIPGLNVALYMIGKTAAAGINVMATYETSLSQVPMFYYPLVLASATLYNAVAIFTAIPIMIIGILFAAYIPLVPYMVFMFTVIGWLLTVIEAVIAAPIVAAGVASPQGHDLLGRSQQIGMMLASVMIRPLCILIGFILAIMVFAASVQLLNQMFVSFFESMANYNVVVQPSSSFSMSHSMSKGFYISMLLTMYLYGLILFSLVRYVFSLTHIVPTYVVRWIGLRPMTGNEEEAIQKVEAGMRDEVIGQGLQGVSSTVDTQKRSLL